MEFKFLSWLFGPKPEDEPDEELPEEETPRSAQPAKEAQPKQLRHSLELPQNHAIHKLWTIYTEQAGWQPKPDLTLEGQGEPPLPDAEGKAELLRLQMFVNASANQRFELLRSQKVETEKGDISLPNLDAQVNVFLSKDCLTAWLLIYPPVGEGRDLSAEDLTQALEQQQVCFGVDDVQLRLLVQDSERYFRLVPIAKGIGAASGMDSRIVDLFPRVPEQKLTVDEHNRVDYTNLNFIQNVEKGGVICRIIPPTEGVVGRTVQDQEIPAKNGKPATVPKGRNTELSEDGQSLIATITGHVEFSGRGFQVKPVLDIPGNVDFSVGNINFLGDVCIHGDVCSGFTVRAMGSITIDGVVESCTIEAGRDLVVARGVQGDNQAVIRAQRSIFAKYLENSCIYAKQNLETECIINCDVYCDGAVTVRTGHSKIIGGKVHAAHEVSSGIIGSRVGNRTDIILGGQPCEEFDYELLVKEIQELEETMERTSRQPDSPSKVSRLGKLRMQLTVNRGKLDLINKERELQTQEPPDPGLRRMRCDTVYPGTVLEIGAVAHRFSDTLSPCSATLVDDEIRVI